MTNQRRSRADEAPPVVAVVNTNDDLVQLLREELLKAGFNVVTGHIRDIKAGLLDFSAFLSSHDPQVVVYDMAIPYEDKLDVPHDVAEAAAQPRRSSSPRSISRRSRSALGRPAPSRFVAAGPTISIRSLRRSRRS
jgi:hypothetical protein